MLVGEQIRVCVCVCVCKIVLGENEQCVHMWR